MLLADRHLALQNTWTTHDEHLILPIMASHRHIERRQRFRCLERRLCPESMVVERQASIHLHATVEHHNMQMTAS